MKIATIERITSVKPHPGADRLDLVQILGYQCVTQKGLYRDGEIVLYIQPDSILPEAEWAEGYRKYSPKRIKAVKLRGEWSEGIIVPLSSFPDLGMSIMIVGMDVAELIGVKHYEPPAPQDLQAKSSALPFGMPKMDEERWENLHQLPLGEKVDVTVKIDGQSWTAYYRIDTDEFGVCGRTQEYKLEAQNNYTRHLEKYKVEEKLKSYCRKHGVSLAIRGESYGNGIQGHKNNPHSKLEPGLAIFSTYLIDERRYARKGQDHYFAYACSEMDLPIVPIAEDVILTQELVNKYSREITEIDGKPFEGVVIQHGPWVVEKAIDTPKGEKKIFDPQRSGSFKIINKHYDSEK